MYKKLTRTSLILSSLLIVFLLAACSGTQSNGNPESPQPSQGSGSLPGGQPPVGAPGASGMPGAGAPSGLPDNGMGKNTQPIISMPDQTATAVGSGTVTVASYANLYFGSAGQVASINVKRGDRVTKGMVLAQLDTSSLEASLAQAQVNLDQARLSQAQALVDLDKANLSLVQANSTLTSAQFQLDKTTAIAEIKDDITDLEWTINSLKVMITDAHNSQDSGSVKSLQQNLTIYEADLSRLKARLSKLLSEDEYLGSNAPSYDVLGETYDRLTLQDVRMKQLAVEAAEKTIDQYKNAIVFAQKNVDKSNDGITLAEKNLALLQKQVDQATIIAPFDGVIATVYQNENDFVVAPAQAQTPLIYMIDPQTMQLDIYVNELDMPLVKTKQKASVNINAFPDAKIDGTVTAISPVSTTLGGVIYYNVTIGFSVPSDINVKIGMNGSAALASQ
jgi:HlyD family secretion protein